MLRESVCITRFWASAAVLAVAACSTEIAPDAAASSDLRSLCLAVDPVQLYPSSQASRDVAFAELQRRGEFTDQELQAIKAGKVYIGMREAAAVCAIEGIRTDVNMTSTAYGTHKQYVLLDGAGYIYTENGVVTAVQQ